jgi:hypothetical protein
VGVAVAEPPEDVEDQDPILHRPPEVPQGVCHALHPTAELTDGEVTLDEGPEARVEAQSPSLSVAQELALKGEPRPARIRGGADEVVEVQRDGPQDPGEDDAVQTKPRRGLDGNRGVDEDVVVEGVAAKSEKDQVPPAGVGGRLGLEDDRDEEANVLDPPGLVVKLSHERIGRVMPEDCGGRHTATRRGRGRGPANRRGRREEALRLGDLTSQGVGRVAFVLPHEGGRAQPGLPLRGGSPGGDEGGVGARAGKGRGCWLFRHHRRGIGIPGGGHRKAPDHLPGV